MIIKLSSGVTLSPEALAREASSFGFKAYERDLIKDTYELTDIEADAVIEIMKEL